MAPTFEELCKCIPKSLKRIKRNNIEYSKIPYEYIDLDLYEPEARCATFRIPKKKLEAWIYAITRCVPHPLHTAESDPPTTFTVIDKYLDDKGHCVSHEPENITVIQYTVFKSIGQCQTKLYTLHLYLSTGVVEIQGNHIQRFHDHEMKRLTDLVSSYIESTKKKDSSILASTEEDLFDLNYSEARASNTKLGSSIPHEYSTDSSPEHQKTPNAPTNASPLKPDDPQQPPPIGDIGTLLQTPPQSSIYAQQSPTATITDVPTNKQSLPKASVLPLTVHQQNDNNTQNHISSDQVKTPSPDKETFLKKAQQLKEKTESVITKLDDHVTNLNTRLCSMEETTALLSRSMLNLTEQVKTILTNIAVIDSKVDTHTVNVNNQKSAVKNLNEIVKKCNHRQINLLTKSNSHTKHIQTHTGCKRN